MLASNDRIETEEALDTRVPKNIRIVDGSLSETEDGRIILTGKIDRDCLRFLMVDGTYQRPLGNRPELERAVRDGVVFPSIELAERSSNFVSDGNDFILTDPTYIIDGWQRVGHILKVMEDDPNIEVNLFAVVHFNSNRLWEAHRFTDLNRNQKRVSPNLHLRNMRDTNVAIATLYGLSMNDKDFPLFHRVSWDQNMHREHLVTASGFMLASGLLHGHISGSQRSQMLKMAESLQRLTKKMKLAQYRSNVKAFWEVVDKAFDIRNVEFRSGAPYLRGAFYQSLARIMDQHYDFWDESQTKLQVRAREVTRLKSFPIRDPNVVYLCGRGGSHHPMLEDMIVTHMNKGRQRSNYLRKREGARD